jgi:uncharacterized membrane protein YphA (DoxX/SURF4 family)
LNGMILRSPGFRRFAILLTRFGLASAYLSAVADRFGVWGRHGTPNVTWGDFQHFVAQVATLLPWAPKSIVPVLAWIASVLEAALGLGLLIGVRTKTMAIGSAFLLIVFGLSMTFSAGGVHSALASSVFSAAGASLLLAYVASNA